MIPEPGQIVAGKLFNEPMRVETAATISGGHDVVEAAREDRSRLKAFVDQGYTEDQAQLRADITAFLEAHPGLRDDVHSTLTNLRDLLKKTRVIAILSDSLIVEPATKTGKKRDF
jgi:hypothetical protein